MSVQAYVIAEKDAPFNSWDDPERGKVSWHTLFSGDILPSEAFTGGVAQVEPNTPLNRHRHAQPEIYFILSGEGIVAIDEKEFPISANMGVFIPGNALHGIRNTGTGPLRLFYCFAVDRFDQVTYDFAG
jgi:mannose-6-phosphate isomerase-like protein (cupin superfamily)